MNCWCDDSRSNRNCKRCDIELISHEDVRRIRNQASGSRVQHVEENAAARDRLQHMQTRRQRLTEAQTEAEN